MKTQGSKFWITTGLCWIVVSGSLVWCTTPAGAQPAARGEKIQRPPKPGAGGPVGAVDLAATNSITSQSNGVGSVPPASSNSAPIFVTVGSEKYRSLSFQELSSFKFKVTPEMSAPDADPKMATQRVLEQLPAVVKDYGDKAVAVTGFMLPVKWSEGLVTDFLLLPNQSGCCYGVTPRINDVIVVRTTGKGVRAEQDTPIVVLGTFTTGALRNNNYLIGIYQIDCEKVVGPDAVKSL